MSEAQKFAEKNAGREVSFEFNGESVNGRVCGWNGFGVIAVDVSDIDGPVGGTVVGLLWRGGYELVGPRPKKYCGRRPELLTLMGDFSDDEKTPVTPPVKKVIDEYPHGPCKRPNCHGQTYLGFNVLVACSNWVCPDHRKV